MPIDFNNLPVLPSPKREAYLRATRLKERQQINAVKSKGRKNHSVNRERSREESARARKVARAIAERFHTLQAYREAVRAYWRGDADNHPTLD